MSFPRLRARRPLTASLAATAVCLTAAACASSPTSAAPSMSAASGSPTSSSAMPGMGAMPVGDGLAASSGGYRLLAATSTLASSRPASYRFTITGPDGRPVTDFAVDQTKKLHFYAIRSDLTGFQHVHPSMAPDGTWTARLAALRPGRWRVFATFIPDTGSGKGDEFVLSRTLTVPGAAATTALPPAAARTTVDGYTVTVSGQLMAGMAHPLTLTLTRGGRPVTDLQPYLDAYAHLTAFHAGDQAFAHLHPVTSATAGGAGPTLVFHAELAKPGDWRLFAQFQVAGRLHTAAITVHVD